MANINISRRNFLAATGMAGAATLAATALGCTPKTTEDTTGDAAAAADGQQAGIPEFLVKPAEIADFTDEKEFDVVVIGAGNSGVAAALSAFEEGASVAVLQKQAEPSAFGFRASGIDLSATDEAGKQAAINSMMKACGWRPKRSLLEAYANTSGEAIAWVVDRLSQAGIEQRTTSNDSFDFEYCGAKAHFISAIPDPNWMAATPTLAGYAESQGVSFFYETPAVQLVKENNRVTGVIAGSEGAYTLFKANRAVILSTGDYCGNADMIHYYCPDVDGFPPLTEGRTGDGHCMGFWAGGVIEPVGHTKMIHDYWQNSAPFMLVGPDGKRMVDEFIPWYNLNTVMRGIMQNAQDPNDATIYSIMDANWKAQATAWAEMEPNAQIHAEDCNPETVTTADTLEELADLINVDKGAFLESVARYNELVAKGVDEDFGKDPRFLAPIEEGPFTAVQRDFNWGLSAVLGGLVVDEENRVLDEADEVIPGLYATGNVSGPFFGGIDYSMEIEGLSIGRAITTGYIAGRSAAHA